MVSLNTVSVCLNKTCSVDNHLGEWFHKQPWNRFPLFSPERTAIYQAQSTISFTDPRQPPEERLNAQTNAEMLHCQITERIESLEYIW